MDHHLPLDFHDLLDHILLDCAPLLIPGQVFAVHRTALNPALKPLHLVLENVVSALHRKAAHLHAALQIL